MTIDSVTAEALYLGICTDTGQFCYSGTNASVFEVCRRLCEAGANPSSVAHELYEREKPGRNSTFAEIPRELSDGIR